MWSYDNELILIKDKPRREKEIFGRGLGREGGREGEFQIGDAHVTHIGWLKIRHLALETFKVRSKTCKVLRVKCCAKNRRYKLIRVTPPFLYELSEIADNS